MKRKKKKKEKGKRNRNEFDRGRKVARDSREYASRENRAIYRWSFPGKVSPADFRQTWVSVDRHDSFEVEYSITRADF